MFRIGIRLCPPARSLVSSSASRRVSRASSSERGATYVNGAGFIEAHPPAQASAEALSGGRGNRRQTRECTALRDVVRGACTSLQEIFSFRCRVLQARLPSF